MDFFFGCLANLGSNDCAAGIPNENPDAVLLAPSADPFEESKRAYDDVAEVPIENVVSFEVTTVALAADAEAPKENSEVKSVGFLCENCAYADDVAEVPIENVVSFEVTTVALAADAEAPRENSEAKSVGYLCEKCAPASDAESSNEWSNSDPLVELAQPKNGRADSEPLNEKAAASPDC